ncbi:channel protein TolC [Leptospira yasudae]|uniref:Channel protein TolC n=2 Tax=Leptospira yasudae TaxID=2202201 RepID=A0A6N4QH07_9LEPT|nr:TolC family protein [Leptospira yasudae]TGL79184.1 channel protein TolC [Leptospira yasudae]TGL83242.1 channel protein TolC [Leptospira yasudae]TGL85747.1 channel protein TolC [Leptospira yasudae]
MEPICAFLLFFFITFGVNSQTDVSKSPPMKITLDQAVLVGSSNSVVLKVLEARKDVSKMVITEKWREFLPKFGIQYYGLRNQNVNSTDNIYNDIRLTVQQLIFDGGEANLNLEIAKLSELLNEQDFKINLSRLRLEIQKAYFKSLATRGKVFIQKKALEKAQEAYRKGQVEFRQGFITKIQLLDLESKVKQSEFNVQKSKNDSDQSLLDLKQVMNLDYYANIELDENLFFDFVINPPPSVNIDELISKARNGREDLKKMQVLVKKIKNEKEILDNYYMPKVYLGGYAGRNGNNNQFSHDSYGVNFNLVMPLGSSVIQSNGNTGVQKDGNGIQTYPGFGNQTVGPGTNSYNSTSVRLFDNLSQSRKAVEGEIQLTEALLNYRNMENQVGFEIKKTVDKLNQSWELINIANSRINLQIESGRVTAAKVAHGQAKKEDQINSELEMIKSQEDLTDALASYAINCFEYAQVTTDEGGLRKLISYSKGSGNSILSNLIRNHETGNKPKK